MISCCHPVSELKNADEIRVDYNDLAILSHLVTEDWVCSADIVIYIPTNQMIDWAKIKLYQDSLNITIAPSDTRIIREAQSEGFPAFWSYPVTSFWELRSLLDLEVTQVLIDAPLYFSLPKVEQACGEDVELRLCANQCMNMHLPHKNGICGTYIRPEDIDEYAQYVDHIEFVADTLSQELTLVKIYKEKKEWPGNLNILLKDLHANADNRGFDALFNNRDDDKYFARRRITCGQVCQENPNRCHFCVNAFNLVNNIRTHQKELMEQLEELD